MVSGPSKATGAALHLVPVSGKTTWLFVELRAGHESFGWGEVTDFGNENAVAAEVRALDARLQGNAADSLPAILEHLNGRQVSQARRILRSGVEQAWLDGAARGMDVSVAKNLGGPYRTSIPVYANINRGIARDRRPEDFADQARLALLDGYRAIKIAPFDGVDWRQGPRGRQGDLRDRGIARIEAVREAIGPDTDLMIDCHGRFDMTTALHVLDAIAPLSPFWVEDVLAPENAAVDQRALRSAAHRHGIRVAGGEEVEDISGLLAFIDAGATDVVLPDLRLTGIRHGMAMCEFAAAKGQLVSLHNPVGPVLDAVSRHVAAALPDFLILERPVRESPMWENLNPQGATLVDGCAVFGPHPGLGIALTAEHLAGPEALSGLPVTSFRGMPGAGPDA